MSLRHPIPILVCALTQFPCALTEFACDVTQVRSAERGGAEPYFGELSLFHEGLCEHTATHCNTLQHTATYCNNTATR